VTEHDAVATGACRLCGQTLSETFVDLGLSPLSNAYVPPDRLSQKENFYPLHVFVCGRCLLVQLDEFESPENIFSDYLYFSSFSDLWLAHCRAYADNMVERFGLGRHSQVVEVASNDGYLLQYFLPHGVPVLGVEPAANVAQTAIAKGIPTEVAFFGAETARRLRDRGVEADLIAGNNVLAHVPRLRDFVQGLQILLKPEGVVTIEVPHLLRLVAENQFDTIYHEHFSYFSLLVLQTLFATVDMRIVDVEELWTHGGSLRVYVRHANAAGASTQAVADVLARERAAGLDALPGYRRFASQVVKTKCDVLAFFIEAARRGQTVVGYGAPAKGNTLLNYCGIGPELMPFTVDRSHHKQGLYLPGTRIPIRAPEALAAARPDYVFILPWNLRAEITQQMSAVREWGGRFVVPIPELTVF
jgi:2-polyprenyl-3-methyl-5-hydroxy-6-metoxy-1,4-benzoquinol methylase